MGNYTIFWMFENPRKGSQARNFTTNVPKILDLKLGAPVFLDDKTQFSAIVTSCVII